MKFFFKFKGVHKSFKLKNNSEYDKITYSSL